MNMKREIEKVADIFNYEERSKVGDVWHGDGGFLFRSTLVTGLGYETIQEVPERILRGISDADDDTLYPSFYNFERFSEMVDACAAELGRRDLPIAVY